MVVVVDLYEDFVFWCLKLKVLWCIDDKMEVELEIGFKFFVERYIFYIELKSLSFIKVFIYNFFILIIFILLSLKFI